LTVAEPEIEPSPASTPYERLSGHRKRFVDAYIGPANCNAAKAARLAGYAEASAKVQGHRNLQVPEVKAAISERLDELAMPAKEVLARLTGIARGSLGDFVEVLPEGKWRLDLERAEREGSLYLIHELSETEHGPKIKLHDPLTALQLLGKHHRLFIDKTEAEVKVTGFEGWTVEELETYASTGQPPSPRSAVSSHSTTGSGA